MPLVLTDTTNENPSNVYNDYLWGVGPSLLGQNAELPSEQLPIADGLGSIRLVLGYSGTVTSTQKTDPFGAIQSATGTPFPFGYTGQQTDTETGLQYLRARYYIPGQGALAYHAALL